MFFTEFFQIPNLLEQALPTNKRRIWDKKINQRRSVGTALIRIIILQAAVLQTQLNILKELDVNPFECTDPDEETANPPTMELVDSD